MKEKILPFNDYRIQPNEMGLEFSPYVIYYYTFPADSKWGLENLEERMKSYQRDGGLFGKDVEIFMSQVFSNLSQTKMGEQWDLNIDGTSERVEVKSTGKDNRCFMGTSGMKGMGRTGYDIKLQLERFEIVDYYTIVDKSTLPNIKLVTMPTKAHSDITKKLSVENLTLSDIGTLISIASFVHNNVNDKVIVTRPEIVDPLFS